MIKKVWRFYYEGFRDMSVHGKRLWLIIIIKLIIMFVILKVFFFQGYLSSNFDTDEQKIEHISNQLTNIK